MFMWMRAACWVAVLGVAPLWSAGLPQPVDWAPVRWPWSDAASLELLDGTPFNCLLLGSGSAEVATAAPARNVVTLAVLTPGGNVAERVRQALAAKFTGVALEGEFPATVTAEARAAAGTAPVIELAPRSRLKAGSSALILATGQGVWPGIAIQEGGAAKAGPSGTAWIDTNTGFLRAVRAWGGTPLWIANLPPERSVITAQRYQQVIADAAASGARWVVALDGALAAALAKREAAALKTWQGIGAMAAYFEGHPEWRTLGQLGKLAVVQDPAKGGLVSGGILDMIAVKHTPARPVARERLSAEALRGATMAVNLDAEAMTPEQTEVLRNFTRGGGVLLTGPSDWKDRAPEAGRFTLEKAELERLNEIFRDVNSLVGRRNLGVRLFNVASMLSSALVSADGKTEIVHLVNYSDYPVENVTMHFLGEFKRATLLSPGGAAQALEIYRTEDGWGVDIDKVGVCATIRLEL